MSQCKILKIVINIIFKKKKLKNEGESMYYALFAECRIYYIIYSVWTFYLINFIYIC